MIYQKIKLFIAKIGQHNRTIFSAAALIAIITFAVKFVAMLKELVVASHFGTSEVLDVFLIAYLIPSFAISIFAGNFSAAVIPPFIEIRKQNGAEAAKRYLATTMVITLGLLSMIAAILALSGPLALNLLSSNLSAETQSLSLSLYFILLPIIMLAGIVDIFSALLKAEKKFILAAFTPMLVPLTVLFSLLILSSDIGIYAYAYGEFFGSLAGIVLLAIGLKKYNLFVYPKWYGIDNNVRQTMSQYIPLISSSMIICSAPVIDIVMASTLEPGSVSSLTYGNKITTVILSISSIALVSSLLPYFSSMVANKEWKSVQHTINFFMKTVFITTIPMMIVFMLFSEQITRLLFERGEFTGQDTLVVSQIFFFYLLQMPFFIADMIWISLIYALKVNQILLLGNIITIILNIAGNYFFMQIWGIAGIALSTALVLFISFIYLTITARRALARAIQASPEQGVQ
ncbi:MAG TPA: virulence factor MviN [Gammaproteobacteria bacterium]|nr:virulence factor MviN [Gammaproteobacteria bacterium]